MASTRVTISVVTPTLQRPAEVAGLLENLAQQSHLPAELIIVDAAARADSRTERAVAEMSSSRPFVCRYLRHGGGTAIQRNVGIDAASGRLIAFIDDDVRLDPDFFRVIVEVFSRDADGRVGGVVGYRENEHGAVATSERWRWYRRLRLFTTYEPGRYDFATGYPINANLQGPFRGVRGVDFMTSSCAVWRREVFDAGLRFDPFFRDYGVLEDAHLSLRARRQWELLQCGEARCVELRSPRGREDRRRIGYKAVVNYYYVFRDIVRPLRLRHQWRFWRFQVFELFRVTASGLRRRRPSDFRELRGRVEGFLAVARHRWTGR